MKKPRWVPLDVRVFLGEVNPMTRLGYELGPRRGIAKYCSPEKANPAVDPCRAWPALLDRQIGRRRLHDALAAAATELWPNMADYLEAGWNLLQDLGDVLTGFAKTGAAAARGDRFVEGQDRSQLILVPDCLDHYVGEDNPGTLHFSEASPEWFSTTQVTGAIMLLALWEIRYS